MTDPSPQYQAPDISLRGAEHVRLYQETGGERGHLWNGVPVLLLTTTGRRTGTPRTSALIYARDGKDYLVIASYGGAPRHPAWYLNLQAHPGARIQVRDQHFEVTAHTVEQEGERRRLWEVVTTQWPNYDAYQARTSRRIPVVVLRPA